MTLQQLYAAMDSKELVKIIIHKEQYTPEAIKAAKAELKKRGETTETLAPILKEVKKEKRAFEEQLKVIQEKSLGSVQRFFFYLPCACDLLSHFHASRLENTQVTSRIMPLARIPFVYRGTNFDCLRLCIHRSDFRSLAAS